jgi:hypothetical protein
MILLVSGLLLCLLLLPEYGGDTINRTTKGYNPKVSTVINLLYLYSGTLSQFHVSQLICCTQIFKTFIWISRNINLVYTGFYLEIFSLRISIPW